MQNDITSFADTINTDLKLLKKSRKCEIAKPITFFGSARLGCESPYYEQAKNLAYECVKAGFSVITGGGGGIMQAANDGAFNATKTLSKNEQEKSLKSIGFNIFLPFEQKGNDFLHYNITFKSLAIRKMALIEKSLAFVIFPGGFGTLDEFVEVLTLKQLGFKNVPIFAVGEQFWRGFDEFIKASLLPLKVISKGDELRYEITDDLNLILSKLKQLL